MKYSLRWVVGLAVVWPWVVASTGWAVTPAMLLGPDLEAKRVTVSSLRDGQLSVFDANRTLQTLMPGQYLQLRFVADDDANAAGEVVAFQIAGDDPEAAQAEAGAATNQANLPPNLPPEVRMQLMLAQQAQQQALIERARRNALNAAAAAEADNAAAEEANPQAAARAVATTWLELVDGSRLPGVLAGFDEGGQIIRWTHPALIDEARVDLDRIATLSFTGPAPAQSGQPAANDRITLGNGDQLEGFVLAIDEKGIQLQVDGADAATTLPLDRVALIRFANARQPRADHHAITLSDNTRLLASNLTIESDMLAMTGVLPGRPQLLQTIPLEQVRRIDFAGGGVQLRELAEQPWQVASGGEVFGRSVPPRVRDGALRLHAPVRVAFELPPGTQRVAATATLDVDEGATRSAAAWADLDLIVQLDGREIARHHFDPDHPTMQLNFAATSGELTLELDVAANGPIMDRLRITDAVVLTRKE